MSGSEVKLDRVNILLQKGKDILQELSPEAFETMPKSQSTKDEIEAITEALLNTTPKTQAYFPKYYLGMARCRQARAIYDLNQGDKQEVGFNLERAIGAYNQALKGLSGSSQEVQKECKDCITFQVDYLASQKKYNETGYYKDMLREMDELELSQYSERFRILFFTHGITPDIVGYSVPSQLMTTNFSGIEEEDLHVCQKGTRNL